MGSAAGAMVYSTASPRVAFVRKTDLFSYAFLDDPFPPPSLLLGCFAAWCPCIVYSRNRQHFRSLQTQGTVLPAGNEQMDDQCCIYCGLVVVGYAWVLQVRQEVD
jgi:hypothetical protein